ncbi:MAG: hypothetical protein ACI837_002166 [Crocinitomicaceae bacterium]|jgi:hypothetical protein
MTLLEIKETLEEFKLVHCGLSHEAVQIDPQTGMAEKLGSSGELGVYQRVQICEGPLRHYRLGCAHSTANKRFVEIIESTAKSDASIEQQLMEFNRVTSSIYALDHRVGNLEKDRAELLDSSIEIARTSAEVKSELAECKLIHRGYINELDTIKTAAITRIDELIHASAEL